MEYRTSLSTDEVLARAMRHFREGPYRGQVGRGPQSAFVLREASVGLKLLGLLTLALLWPQNKQAVVAAYAEGGATTVVISATHPDFFAPLKTWAERELVENRAAADTLTAEEPPQAASSTIAQQIHDLLLLRNRGAITTAEFEAKKGELLDRM